LRIDDAQKSVFPEKARAMVTIDTRAAAAPMIT